MTVRPAELLEQAERQIEGARAALRVAYTNGWCPACGAADPDDDGHRPECPIGAGFDALDALDREGLAARLKDALTVVEESARAADWFRILIDVAEKHCPESFGIALQAQGGRVRLDALLAALAAFDAGPAATAEAKTK